MEKPVLIENPMKNLIDYLIRYDVSIYIVDSFVFIEMDINERNKLLNFYHSNPTAYWLYIELDNAESIEYYYID